MNQEHVFVWFGAKAPSVCSSKLLLGEAVLLRSACRDDCSHVAGRGPHDGQHVWPRPQEWKAIVNVQAVRSMWAFDNGQQDLPT